jgi:cytosine/adenosine deaminase-related metal-dependent hydrolase
MGLEFEVRAAPGAEEGFVSDLVPEVAEQLSWGALISRQHVEDEIDLALRAVRGFWEMEPDQVMQMASALSARATELSVHLHRLEGKREWRQIRTMQVERLLAELDRQFKIASRMLEVRRQDIETSR